MTLYVPDSRLARHPFCQFFIAAWLNSRFAGAQGRTCVLPHVVGSFSAKHGSHLLWRVVFEEREILVALEGDQKYSRLRLTSIVCPDASVHAVYRRNAPVKLNFFITFLPEFLHICNRLYFGIQNRPLRNTVNTEQNNFSMIKLCRI